MNQNTLPQLRACRPQTSSIMMCTLFYEGKKVVRLRLKEVLEKKGISQSKLSRMADVSLNTIQEMIHNPTHDARISTLVRIAEALGVAVDELYEVVEK